MDIASAINAETDHSESGSDETYQRSSLFLISFEHSSKRQCQQGSHSLMIRWSDRWAGMCLGELVFIDWIVLNPWVPQTWSRNVWWDKIFWELIEGSDVPHDPQKQDQSKELEEKVFPDTRFVFLRRLTAEISPIPKITERRLKNVQNYRTNFATAFFRAHIKSLQKICFVVSCR